MGPWSLGQECQGWLDVMLAILLLCWLEKLVYLRRASDLQPGSLALIQLQLAATSQPNFKGLPLSTSTVPSWPQYS